MQYILASVIILFSVGACSSSSLSKDPKEILSIKGAPEGFTFSKDGVLWVVHRQSETSLLIDRYTPPSYQKDSSITLATDPDFDTALLAASGGHVHLDVRASKNRLALLYSQVNAPPRSTPKGKLLLFSYENNMLKKTATLLQEGRSISLGTNPDLSEIAWVSSKGISIYSPDGKLLRQFIRGLDNELAANLYGEVSFDASGRYMAHWLPSNDPQLSPPALQVIDLQTGENVGPVKAADGPRPAISSDGKLLAYRVAFDIDIYDVEARRRVSILQDSARQDIRSLQFMPGEKILLVDHPDESAIFYDVSPIGLSWNRGSVLSRLPSQELLDFRINFSGDVIAARSNDGERIVLFRVK